MTDLITIGDRKIGTGQPVFIIAEIGVNHNGDVELAKEMIKEAAFCGVDCVKFQTFKAERVVSENAPKAAYQLITTSRDESQLTMLRNLELPENAYRDILACCRKEGLVFMSTPYNHEDVDFLEKLDVPAYKLASIHAFEPSFARYTASKGKPVILSTGMSTLTELDITVSAIRDTGNTDLVLLQCTTNYPSKLEDANLRAMQTLSDAFNVQVGYSDHTQTNIASIIAVGLGATVIEKHFTIDKSLPGPDQSTSANPEEFKQLVEDIRDAEKVLGSASKKPTETEKDNALGMRRSIVAKCDIQKGCKITEDMLIFKRPSGGISPIHADSIIGKSAKKDINAGTLIDWSFIGSGNL